MIFNKDLYKIFQEICYEVWNKKPSVEDYRLELKERDK